MVVGYKKETIDLPNIDVIADDDYKITGEMASLTKAIDTAQEGCVILFGDVHFKKYVLSILLDDPSDIVHYCGLCIFS